MSKSDKTAPDLSFEIAFLEGIYKRDRNDSRTVETLANLYTDAGLFAKGLELDQRHVTLEPQNPTAHYNCACSLSLTGAATEAFEELETALKLGFDGLDWMQKDTDLEALRNDPRWALIMAEHGVARADKIE
jgi:hypothetical protein